MTREKPNILFLMTDQHRYDALGCAGNDKIHTPNLDKLAQSGLRFSNAFTPTPVCVAARMTLITGHRAGRTHWVMNQKIPGPSPELPTIMTLLKEEGYRNHAVGKLHFFGRHYGLHSIDSMEETVDYRIDDDYLMYLKDKGIRNPYPHGLRDLLIYQPQSNDIPLEHSPNTWVADRSIEFLRNHVRYRKSQPFFLWSSWIAPHCPFAPCEPFASMYDPKDMSLPVFRERPLNSLPSVCWNERGRMDGSYMDDDRIRKVKALYYGMVTHVDYNIGRILDELDNLGLSDNTVVIFLSDHGDMLGDHGLATKRVPYEPSIHIPLIMRWPGITAKGTVSDDLVGLTDILPTLIQEIGLRYPAEEGVLTGESLTSKEGGGLASGRDAYFIDFGEGRKRWIAIRTRRYMYALWACGGYEELYDMDKDPYQYNNIVKEYPELARHLKARVLAWERVNGLVDSFDENNNFKIYDEIALPSDENDIRTVIINQKRWPDVLPEDEKNSVDPYWKVFSNAIANQPTLSPDKLSIGQYKKKGGDLSNTPWEEAWLKA